MRSSYLFTSESVSEGHPDKVADQISDAIVDLFLSKDPEARVACETMVTTQRIVISGEIRCKDAYDEELFSDTHGWAPGARDEIEQVVRHTIKRIGYEQAGFHWQTASFENHLHGQSAHIAKGVDASGNKDEGAGDQGIMFGFAVDETPELMPATLAYSHKILQRMAADRHSGAAPFLEPDAKSQVTLRYDEGKPVAATAIVVSTQHGRGYDQGDKEAELHAYVKKVIADVLPDGLLSDDTVYHINPTGSFEIGGPDGDAGLTGRKIIVDTYGGAAPHGGGAFSGKDPTKVDRSAAYAARYLAKNIVAAGLARRCTIQLAYAIGVSEPLSLYVNTHGTGALDDALLEQAIGRITRLGGLTPRGIRTLLGLNRPIYEATAAYGHFGRTPEGELFPWERLDLVDDLKAAAGVEALPVEAQLAPMTAHKPGDPTTLNRLYGRASGHKLRPGQQALVDQLLPKIAVPEEGEIGARRLFGDDRPLHLEIGFGSGEHLASRADLLPDHGFIGAEPFLNGVAAALAHVRDQHLANVRLWRGDALDVLKRVPDGALSFLYLLHPDPWPKARHAKRRMVNDGPLTIFAAKLKRGGELRIATDDPTYLTWALMVMQRHEAQFEWLAERPSDFLDPPAGWIETRYGAKSRREGRQPYYLRYRRR